jgi:S-adenosylmethionine hydrolase
MIITLTSDLGVQSHRVGMMEAAIVGIAPEARVIHHRHGLPDYHTVSAARVLPRERLPLAPPNEG